MYMSFNMQLVIRTEHIKLSYTIYIYSTRCTAQFVPVRAHIKKKFFSAWLPIVQTRANVSRHSNELYSVHHSKVEFLRIQTRCSSHTKMAIADCQGNRKKNRMYYKNLILGMKHCEYSNNHGSLESWELVVQIESQVANCQSIEFTPFPPTFPSFKISSKYGQTCI